MKISYLPYKEINKAKWDQCVREARNRLIYGFSFYLDNMAANWDGLVLNNYEAVMPLTWKKKLQVKYLYQPAFMQQGGIFSGAEASSELTDAFIDEAAKHFRFAEISLNYGNEAGQSGIATQARRINYILLLHDYEKVFSSYEPSFRKSLRRIKKFALRYEETENYTSIINLYKDLYGKRLPSFLPADYRNIMEVCTALARENKLVSRLAYSENRLVAAAVLLKDDSRLYNLVSCINADGKKLEANYFLYDKIVEEFSGKGWVLDLEGSEVPGIAAFYKKMNPEVQPYLKIKYNELPLFLRVFKK